MKSGIYKIENLVNNKLYIGYASHLSKRKGDHFRALRNKEHFNTHLQDAWNIYKEESFKFEIIEKCPASFLCEREHYWATILNVHDNRFGYNLNPTHPEGRALKTEETKRKMSLCKTGLKHTEESKKKMSLAKLGKPSPNRGKKRPNSNGKKILQYDLEGNYLQEWEHARKIREHYNYKQYSLINACARGNRRNAYGYIWKYKEEADFPRKIEVVFIKRSKYRNPAVLDATIIKNASVESLEAIPGTFSPEQGDSLPKIKEEI